MGRRQEKAEDEGGGDTDLVRGGLELVASNVGDLSSDFDVEALLGIETLSRRLLSTKLAESTDPGTYRSDSGATLSEEAQSWKHVLKTLNSVCDLLDVAAEFLAKCQWCCILQRRSDQAGPVWSCEANLPANECVQS